MGHSQGGNLWGNQHEFNDYGPSLCPQVTCTENCSKTQKSPSASVLGEGPPCLAVGGRKGKVLLRVWVQTRVGALDGKGPLAPRQAWGTVNIKTNECSSRLGTSPLLLRLSWVFLQTTWCEVSNITTEIQLKGETSLPTYRRRFPPSPLAQPGSSSLFAQTPLPISAHWRLWSFTSEQFPLNCQQLRLEKQLARCQPSCHLPPQFYSFSDHSWGGRWSPLRALLFEPAMNLKLGQKITTKTQI